MKPIKFFITALIVIGFVVIFESCATTGGEQDIFGEALTEEAIDTTGGADLEAEINKLQAEKATLEKEKADLEKQVKALKQENQRLSAKIAELGSQLETEKEKTRELSARLSELKAGGASDTLVQSLKSKIAQLENELASYKQQVRDLQAKLAEAEVSGMKAGEAVPAFPEIPKKGVFEMTEAEFKDYYKMGLKLFNQRKYKEAIAYFDTLLKSTVQTKLKINCVYWIGESYFGLKKYKDAIKYFEYVANQKSVKTPDALYMLGRCYAALGNIKKAKEYMRRVLKEYPKSSVARKAKIRLERL